MTHGSLAVIVPVLSRPHRVQPLLESLLASVEAERSAGWIVRPVFVATPGDDAELAAIRAAGHEPLLVAAANSQYPIKINTGARAAAEDWLFTGADDLHFHPGWLTHALNAHAASGCLVIGTNDLGNQLVKQGKHSTHSLVHRSYLELGTIDEPGKLMHEGYDHNSSDVEMIETAVARGQFVFARDAVVEHLHPLWHREVKRDSVYQKGFRNAMRDRMLIQRRRPLWNPGAARVHVRGPRYFDPRRRGQERWPKR